VSLSSIECLLRFLLEFWVSCFALVLFLILIRKWFSHYITNLKLSSLGYIHLKTHLLLGDFIMYVCVCVCVCFTVKWAYNTVLI